MFGHLLMNYGKYSISREKKMKFLIKSFNGGVVVILLNIYLFDEGGVVCYLSDELYYYYLSYLSYLFTTINL